jgi:membrane protein YdbS with pleckstrin-like domain
MLLLSPIVAAVMGMVLFIQQQPGEASTVFLAGAFAIAVTILFTLPCRYTLLDDTLNVRCGIICYSISLDTIENVELSSSWLSGPALSLKRVRVTARGRHYLLSPKNRDAFIDELNLRRSTESGV